MSTSLECRLLCASMTAYSLTNDGPITAQQPYFDAAQFLDYPVGFVSGNEVINACLVGTIADWRHRRLSRYLTAGQSGLGTEDSLDQRTWMPSCCEAPACRGWCTRDSGGSLYSWWLTLARSPKAPHASYTSQLYVTRHSKGGAVADLCGDAFLDRAWPWREGVHLAAPHPGNCYSAAAYDGHIASVRYEYADDIVPLLPPSFAFRQDASDCALREAGCASARSRLLRGGHPALHHSTGAIVADSPMLRFQRYTRLAELMVTGGFEEIAKDHRGVCGGGYMGAVARRASARDRAAHGSSAGCRYRRRMPVTRTVRPTRVTSRRDQPRSRPAKCRVSAVDCPALDGPPLFR